MANEIKIKRQGSFNKSLDLDGVKALLENEFTNIVNVINGVTSLVKVTTSKIQSTTTTTGTTTTNDPNASVNIITNTINTKFSSGLQLLPIQKDMLSTDLNTPGFSIGQVPGNSMILLFIVICDAKLNGLTKFEITNGVGSVVIKNNDIDYSKASYNICYPQITKVTEGTELLWTGTGTVTSGTCTIFALLATRTT